MSSYFKQLMVNKKAKACFYFYTEFNLPSVCIDSLMLSLANGILKPCHALCPPVFKN